TFPSADYVSIMLKEGMLEQLDKTKIPNLSQIDPYFAKKMTFDIGNNYSVPYVMGAACIAVNKAKVKDYPKNYHIYEMAQYKGRMTMLDEMREVLGAALKTLGYSVNSTDEAELRKAKELVLKWKENIQKYDSESFGKGFASGEFWIVQGYAENIHKEADDAMKNDIEYIIPDTGGTMYVDNMVILKDAKNKKLAYEFINYIHDSAVFASICDDFRLPSVNLGARKIAKEKPLYSFEALKKCELQEDLGEKLDLYNTIWQEIRIEN
ncbi:MAG: extracellular solute-binding protein, partial [Spirochaetota bacterium]